MVQQILAVFLVLGLLLSALWLLRRNGLATFNFVANSRLMKGRRSQEKRLRVLERVILTPQHSLHLVVLDNRLMVFTASSNGCTAIDPLLFSFPDQGTNSSLGNAASC